MALKARKITIGTTAATIEMAQTDSISGSSLTMQIPVGGKTVHVGGADVNTTDKGFPVAGGMYLDLELDSGTDVLYAVAAEPQDVYCLWRGV